MPDILTDTHALIWHVTEPARLSAPALRALRQATATGGQLYVSAISIMEIQYLVEKSRLPHLVRDRIDAAVADPETGLTIVPVDALVAHALRSVPRAEVPDMPDRIITATALRLGVPLISGDGRIWPSRVTTIW